MEKMVITSGENKVNVDTGLTGNGTSENPLQYTGEIQHSDKRSLLWESTGNDYNTNIELSETIHHFDKVMIYGSGLEAADTMHVSKNVYTVQPNLINGCDVWGYSPWTTAFQANYILGADLKLSGNSGHIGSSYYWGIGSKNATWAAGKWTGTEAPKMLMPWKIFGLGRHPTYNFYGLQSEGGSVASNIPSGYSGDIATITVTPESDVWRQSALNITGAELTGNDFMFENSNVTAQAEFEHSRDLTLVPNEHATLSADKMSGFSGDVVTVDATTDEGWYFTGLNVTGATATGNQFMFVGNDVTAEGLYTDAGYPITYLSDEHVHLTGDQIYVPGSEGITLDSGYDTYYRISGYDITGGSIVDGKLVPTGPCTIKAVEKVNAFTATGRWLNMTTNSTGNIPYYAVSLCTYKTDNTPSNFLVKAAAGSRSTNSGWQGGACSGYKLSTNSISRSYKRGSGITGGAGMRLYVGGTTLFSQNFGGKYNWEGNITAAAKTTTTTGLLKYTIVDTLSYQYGKINDNNTAFNWTATGIAP